LRPVAPSSRNRRTHRKAHCRDTPSSAANHARKIAYHLPEFRRLIIQAKDDGLHKMLGFKSWTDYVADVVGKDMTKLPVDDRRQIVELLAGEGMSQRQIAAAVGVSQKTVDRDLDQVSQNDSPDDQVITEPKPITGRDGKTYRPKPPQPQQDRPLPVSRSSSRENS
jgi:transposase-like protein